MTKRKHYGDVIIRVMASRMTRLTIVCSNDYAGADQRKHQSSASLAFMRGIRRWPVNSPHKVPVTRKTFPFDDVIMNLKNLRPCKWGKCVPPTLMKSSGWLETYIYLTPCLILGDYLRLLFLKVELDEYCWTIYFHFINIILTKVSAVNTKVFDQKMYSRKPHMC